MLHIAYQPFPYMKLTLLRIHFNCFLSLKTQINGDVKAADVKFSVQNEKVAETGMKNMAKSPLLAVVQRSSLELEKILTGTN